MAINAGTILAYLDLDTSNFGNALQTAQSQITSFANEGAGISGVLDGVGAAATILGRTMTMGVTTPLVGMGMAAVNTGMAFDTSMSNVLALSGATASEFAVLREEALKMGANTKFSATQAADAFGFMALAGWDAQQMIGGIPGVLDLAAAANMDLARASDIVTDSMTPFGMAAEEAARASDVFAYAQANSNATVQQLGDSMKFVAPNAAAFSMTLEDTAGALGMLANAGIKGSMAGTTLNAILRDMKKNAEDGELAIGKSKVAITDATGAYRPYADIIRDIEIAIHGMSEGQRDAALSAVFGDEAIKGINVTLAQGSEALQAFTDDLYNSKDAASTMAAIMQDNLQGDITTLKSGAEGMAIALSDFLTPAIRTVVQGITRGVQWFNSLDTGIKNIVFRIGAVAAAIGPALLVGGKLLGLVSGFAGPLGLVASGVALVYGHSERLQGIVATVTDTVGGFFTGVKDAMGTYREAIAAGETQTNALNKALTTAFGAKAAANIQRVTKALQTGFTKASSVLKGSADAVGSLFGALIDGRPALEALETSLSQTFGENTVRRVMSAATAVRDTFAPAIAVAQDFATRAGEALRNLWDNLPSMLDSMKAAFGAAQSYLSELASDIQTAWSEDGILGVFSTLGTHIAEALRAAGPAVLEGASSIKDKIGEGLSMAADWFLPKAQEWMTNLGSALESAKHYAVDKLPAIRDAIAEGLQVAKTTLLEKAGQVMQWLGDAYRSESVQNLIGNLSGVASSVLSKITTAKEAITTKAGELLSALGTALGSEEAKAKITEITGVVATLGERIASNVGAWQTTAARLIGDLVAQLTNNGFLQSTITGLGNIVTAIANGIGTAASNITTCATEIISALVGKLTESDFVESVFTTGGQVVTAIGDVLASATEGISTAAVSIGTALVNGIAAIDWPTIFTSAGTVVTNLLEQLYKAEASIATGASKLMGAVAQAMGNVDWSSMGTSLSTTATNLINAILDNLPDRIDRATELVSKIGEGISVAASGLAEAASSLVSSLVTWLLTPANWLKLLTVGGSLVEGILQGILTLGASILGGATEFLIGIVSGISETVLTMLGVKMEDITYTSQDYLAALDASLLSSTDGLNHALEMRASLMAQGITEGLDQAAWLGNEAVVALFRTLIDETASQADRATAMAALHMAGFAPAIGDAMKVGGPEVYEQAESLMNKGVEAVDNALSGMGVKLVGSISEGVQGALPTLELAAQDVADTASIVDEKANVEENARDVGESSSKKVAEGETAAAGEVTTATQTVSDNVTNTLEPLPGLMEELSKNGVTGMATAVTTNASAVTSAVQTMSDNTVNAALQTMSVETGQRIGTEFAGGIASGVQGALGTVLSGAYSVGQNTVSALRSILSHGTGYSIGQAMIQAIASGATSAGGALISAMSSLASQAVAAFKAGIDMNSPPRAFTEIGEAIPGAVGLGTDRRQGDATRAILRLAESLVDAWIPPDFDDLWSIDPKRHPRIGQGGAGTGGNTYNFYGDMHVREDADIERIAKAIGDETSDDIRGGGGR